jgi:hypothetical protein
MHAASHLQDMFSQWLAAVTKDLDVVKGWQSARLLETDAADGGRLKVLFSKRLSNIVTAVRSVAALGFRIPRALDGAVQVHAPFLMLLNCHWRPQASIIL